jgi:ATP-binding cassette subfamily G (WHITE) protein 2 (SNQ2)
MWKGVTYKVPTKDGDRTLLDNVNGFVVPGKLTALMGESGAGKTTLLNVLAQRVTMGTITGDMLVNGRPLPNSFQRQTGYCQQQDVHLPTTTVREALEFSALLRQPKSTPKKEKLAYVDNVIKMLEMESFENALVGEVGEGLNVEQRKRLTVGVELAARPALLVFADEPTSGLDSQSAWSIVQFLRKLADHGQAILCTIHQPSSELFQVFDRLLLLKKGGKTVYFGDIGKNSRTLIDYFESHGAKKCGEEANPAEYILECVGAGATAKVSEDWGDIWQKSEERKVVDKELERLVNESKGKKSQEDDAPDAGRKYAVSGSSWLPPRARLIWHVCFQAGFGTQLSVVTKRIFQNYWRDPVYFFGKLSNNILAGLYIGTADTFTTR